MLVFLPQSDTGHSAPQFFIVPVMPGKQEPWHLSAAPVPPDCCHLGEIPELEFPAEFGSSHLSVEKKGIASLTRGPSSQTNAG
jgi:hypothetical protein